MTAENPVAHTDESETMLGNLPIQLTALLGRADELKELEATLWRARLLTLSGPGGVGKSRLAMGLAEAVRADFIGGGWWADLADVAEDARVAQTVAAALMPGEQLNDPAAASGRLLGSSSLLVLDNCEQVVAGTAQVVTELLARAPALRVIVTSRQPLGIGGEQVWRVPGLAIDAAAALFARRAQESAGGFAMDAAGVREGVAEVCALLDGLPLAVELAALRVSVLSVEQIAERLRDDTSLLRHPSRAAQGRHRTLDDTLEWSHQLLAPAAQRLFRRLSVFRGPFSLRAAEAVCADGLVPTDEILDLLSQLIDQSLVQSVESPTLPRYRLLATLRRYGWGKLEAAGELPGIVQRHATHYHGMGERARAGLSGGEQVAWVEGIELDHENLSEALRTLFAGRAVEAAELAAALWPFYYQRGYYAEARQCYEQALLGADALPAPILIEVLLKAGEVAFLQCDYVEAGARLERVLPLLGDSQADRRAEAVVRQRLGSIARERARYEEARELHAQSLAIWEALGEPEGVASSQNYLGFVAWLSGDFAGAESLCLPALAAFRAGGNLRDVAATLINLGAAALYGGEPELAAERLSEALAISRRLGFQEGVAWSLNELAVLGRRRWRSTGEPELMLRDALLVHHRLGDRWRMASVLEEIGGSVLVRRDTSLAVCLLACAQALRERIGTPVPAAEASDRDAALARLARQLTPAGFDSAWADGLELDLDRAVAKAVAAIEALSDGDSDGLGHEIAPILTPRELAVLDLLSRGHTNREIAAALYISPSTAGVHVSNILRKLRAKRRVDAAGRAHTLGLLPTA
ncbi:MAG TPA: tetratricopeptide repeat protein [Solirubrobacteraceae bacterium]|nr:tetratricopeptide repeat protein [Solirubrobacteraceae bacterium]